MTIDQILGLLDGVRPRGTGKWSSKCPAHADRSPSLSLAEGDRGILLHCWAGCTIDEITAAIGLRPSDLFRDACPNPETRRQRDLARQARARERHLDGLTIHSIRDAEHYIQSRRGIDISTWTDDQLDAELAALAHAYRIMGDRHDHA